MKYKIAHITTIHTRGDQRIFLKECSSLAKIDKYDVNLIVSDGLGDVILNNVKIHDINVIIKKRILRFFLTSISALKKALKLDCHIYHFHDPELLFIGLLLKIFGKRVIFDSHETVYKQILEKPYLNEYIGLIISKIYRIVEVIICFWFDYIIAATPYIKEHFLKFNTNTMDINNYPIVGELSNSIPFNKKKNHICFIGSISKKRGIIENIQSLEYVNNCTLTIAGEFETESLEKEIKNLKGWNKVNYLGFVGRNEVKSILENSRIGLVTFHPIGNFIEAHPIKMFEYMLAGIPVITSNFKLFKKIIEKENCGMCVDPFDPKEIAWAINKLLSSEKQSEEMGKNGHRMIIKKYNWATEEKKLLKIYENVLSRIN